jgi:hypothetical protein
VDSRARPEQGKDHSHRGGVMLGLPALRVPAKPCDDSPLAGAT